MVVSLVLSLALNASASKNDAGIIAGVLLRYTTSSFEALTSLCSIYEGERQYLN